jgi:alpha-glucosidase
MKRGMAGFRLDAVPSLFEDPQLRDEKLLDGKNEYGDVPVSREYTDNLPEVHDVLREMRQVSNEFPGRVLIGETYVPNIGDLAKMYGRKNDELQLPMDMQYGMLNTLSADGFRRKLRDAETGLNGNAPLFAFDNHDNRRSWNRYGDGKHDAAIAKLIATLLLAPRCVALMYYGEELGMSNNDPKSKDDVKDPIGKLGWPKEVGRDGERTPMQWNGERNSGFSEGKTTWLPVAPNYKTVNAAAESGDPKSILSYYRTLIHLRKENAALRTGELKLIDEENHNVLSFLRTGGGKTVLVSVNFTADPQTIRFEKGLKSLVSSFDGAGAGKGTLQLPPFGAYVGEVQ